MKRFLKVLIATAVALCTVALSAVVSGCKKEDGYKVYAPDGAPALSLYALSDEKYSAFSVSAVNAETIATYVTGNSPKADFAVLPVNSAVKLLGGGENYRMLGTVTHGNLFILKKANGVEIGGTDDLTKLVGKTVGVVNLANVPGLTFKSILSDNGVEFNELKDGAAPDGAKVNLKAVSGTEVLPTNADCDYFVAPEPAVSTKVKATKGALSVAGSLQTLYGVGGYPQAVAVARVSVYQNDKRAVDDFVKALTDARALLLNENTSAEAVVNAVKGWLDGDAKPTFTAENLNKSVIENCGIRFESVQSQKAEVLAYMKKVNALTNGAFGTPADLFFG